MKCAESAENGIEMKITIEKDFLEKKFPFRVREFQENDGFYQKIIYQNQLEVEFDDQDCEF